MCLPNTTWTNVNRDSRKRYGPRLEGSLYLIVFDGMRCNRFGVQSRRNQNEQQHGKLTTWDGWPRSRNQLITADTFYTKSSTTTPWESDRSLPQSSLWRHHRLFGATNAHSNWLVRAWFRRLMSTSVPVFLDTKAPGDYISYRSYT